jgi:hypothetical protein
MISKLRRKTASFFFLLSLRLRRLEKWAYAAKVYYRSKSRESRSKTVYFNFPDPYHYNRYYYILAKYFIIEGYTVYMQMDLKTLYRFASDKITHVLLEEPHLIFGKPPKDTLELDAETISRDYFGAHKITGTTYHVPLGHYPVMYSDGHWNSHFDFPKRKNSLYFAGNFQEGNYAQTENDKLFGVHNRLSLYHFLTEKGVITEKNTEKELEDFITSAEDQKFVLVNICLGYKIHYSKILYFMGSFDFMFAFPGVLMPLCHNIVEAMSVGTIPFIQRAYADQVKPPLIDGETCITFDGIDDVLEKIDGVLALPPEKIAQLRANVLRYHETFLTPGAVVKTLEEGNFEKIYLMAEYHSVSLLM